MGLMHINPYSLDIGDFIYHASSDGEIFGYQTPEFIDKYGMYENEEEHLTKIDVLHGNLLSDIGPGFYLGNDLEMSYMWGARNNNCTPVLNIFNLSRVSNSNGYILDIFNDFNDLMAWVAITSEGRNLQGDAINNYSLLVARYGINFNSYSYVIAPRSDDRLWSYTHSYLKEELTTQGLIDCTSQLSAGYQLVIKNANVANSLEFVGYEIYSVGNYPSLYHNFNTNAMHQFFDVTGNAEYSVFLYPDEHNIQHTVNGEVF